MPTRHTHKHNTKKSFRSTKKKNKPRKPDQTRPENQKDMILVVLQKSQKKPKNQIIQKRKKTYSSNHEIGLYVYKCIYDVSQIKMQKNNP